MPRLPDRPDHTRRDRAAKAIYATKSPSIGPKLALLASNISGLALTVWLLLAGGLTLLPSTLPHATPARSWLLVGAAAIYVARLVGTGVMVKRRMPWREAAFIVIWLLVIHTVMATAGGTTGRPVGWLSWLGVALYGVGAWLNTASEAERTAWKRRPENRGHLYTDGLFRHSMHINFFGDTVHFLGWALLAGATWSLAIPAIMFCIFTFANIPTLDAYLARKYGREFTEYAARTKRFIPGIW